MSEALLVLRGLSKRFGATAAVDGVDLEILPGEFFALLGGSGCGKSTLLRLIAGLERPDGGAILLEGRDITREPPYRRPLHMMFQNYALFPHLTVAENIAFGLRRQGWRTPAIAARVEEMLALTHLTELAQRKPHQLSGGQQQRVALARALAPRPRLVLLDEPLSALDRKLRQAMRTELAAIQREVGITFIIVTHDQEEAMSLASRVAVMDKGRILQVDRPQALYERPRDRFVASFIGQVNVLAGTFRSDGGRLLFDCPALGACFQIAEPLPGARTLAIRPEKLRLADPSGPRLPNHFRARVESIEYRGENSLIRLEAGALSLLALHVHRDRRGDEDPPIGAEVCLEFGPADAFLLPD
ncbi:MAG: spermidine/putrescine ABC transporter ATP-binding protein [Lysobacterales bacterium]|jgi:putrescine transport system ATP-binding protein|nr:MAG: spermidine/putrescine ABC transporter ATP-binding protein [Xanthomonadales bacterium]